MSTSQPISQKDLFNLYNQLSEKFTEAIKTVSRSLGLPLGAGDPATSATATRTNLFHPLSEAQRAHAIKFVRLLPDLEFKNLRWLQCYYNVLTMPADISDTNKLMLLQQLGAIPERRLRPEYPPSNQNQSQNRFNNQQSPNQTFRLRPPFPARPPLKQE